MKWKDRLLSSSIPLEYEIGRILAKNEFSVDFDFSYKRHDGKEEKEFSVDIYARGYYPFNFNSIDIEIELLVECKYRNPNTSWLFIKDFNIDIFENFSSKGVIKVIDEFSEIFSKNSFNNFGGETCLKGIEINTESGEVHDTGIVHGRSQLVYAMPHILYKQISGALYEHLVDVHPLIICPILVTTSELRILKDDFSIENVKQGSSLNEISDVVPYLRLFSSPYPSFDEHCANIFRDIPKDNQFERFEYFKELRKIEFNSKSKMPDIKKMYSQPEDLLKSLKYGFGHDIFMEILVCNKTHFPELLEEIKLEIKYIKSGFKKLKHHKL